MDLKLLVPWYKFPPFSPTSIGGLSVSVWELTRSLVRDGVSVEVLCPSESTSESFDKIDGVNIVCNSLGRKVVENRKLEKEEEKQLLGFDIILSVNNLGSNPLSNVKSNVIRQIHTVASDRPLSSYFPLHSGITDFLKMYLQRNREISWERTLSGVGTICVSRYNLLKMEEKQLESCENLSHIPNGLSTSVFKPLKEEKKYDIIFIGRFQKVKGLDLLLGALSLLHSQDKNLTLGIIGSFPAIAQKYCLNLIPEEIRKNIQFLGLRKREEVPKLINASRIVVVPSRYESFSLPSLEAVSCGIPVVAYSVGGIPEIVESENGILVERISPDFLAESIKKALDSPELIESAKLSGPKKAVAFDINTVSRKLVRYFDSRLAGSDIQTRTDLKG